MAPEFKTVHTRKRIKTHRVRLAAVRCQPSLLIGVQLQPGRCVRLPHQHAASQQQANAQTGRPALKHTKQEHDSPPEVKRIVNAALAYVQMPRHHHLGSMRSPGIRS